MEQRTIEPWDVLACPECGAEEFLAVVSLQRRRNAGTIPAPKGYRCAVCLKKVDLLQMNQLADIQRDEKELTQRRQELEEKRRIAIPAMRGSGAS